MILIFQNKSFILKEKATKIDFWCHIKLSNHLEYILVLAENLGKAENFKWIRILFINVILYW